MHPTATRRTLLSLGLACSMALALPTLATAGLWGKERVVGSGKLLTQQRQSASFDGLALALPAQLELRTGSTDSISIEADDNLLPLIDTVVEDGVLQIRTKQRNLQLDSKALRIVVQARKIERLSLSGAGSIHAAPLHTPTLRVDLGGSGSIRLDSVRSDSLALAVGGSGQVISNGGRVGKLRVSIGGSGKADLGRLEANSVSVSIGGSGGAQVWATQSLSVSVAGSGSVAYYGAPQLSTSMAGSGSVRALGTTPR